jgi:hypothetical protein
VKKQAKLFALLAMVFLFAFSCVNKNRNAFGINLTSTHKQIKEFNKSDYGFDIKDVVIDSVVIEDIKIKNRALILFMKDCKYFESNAEKQDYYTCPEISRGNYYSGKAYLSLVDTDLKKVVQTIKIPGIKYQKADGKIEEKNIDLPIKIRPGNLYPVNNFKSFFQDETPVVLDLKDFIGDGNKTQFVLFDAIDCAEIDTLLAGYDCEDDKILVYPVELQINKNQGIGYWMDRFYLQQSTKKHVWNYSLNYKHRGGCIDKYNIEYIPAQKSFLGNLSKDCQ